MATYASSLPETMKAVHWTNVGKPADILTLDEHQPLPVPTGTNILVKVHASALNPVDWKLMKGGVPRFLMPKVKTPALDISGTVVGLGPNVGRSNKAGVQKFAIGDRVMAMLNFSKSGGLQEYTLVDESILVKTPLEWDDLAAAAFPLVGTTVYESLVVRGHIKKGDRVLVNGASGGTGSVAVQLATALGASVVGVCSTANVDLVKKLGAVEVVDYTSAKVHEQYSNKEFDIIFDTVGSDQVINLFHLVTLCLLFFLQMCCICINNTLTTIACFFFFIISARTSPFTALCHQRHLAQIQRPVHPDHRRRQHHGLALPPPLLGPPDPPKEAPWPCHLWARLPSLHHLPQRRQPGYRGPYPRESQCETHGCLHVRVHTRPGPRGLQPEPERARQGQAGRHSPIGENKTNTLSYDVMHEIAGMFIISKRLRCSHLLCNFGRVQTRILEDVHGNLASLVAA